MRVMIVDDEPFIREGLKQLIVKLPYDCSIDAEAENGIQAIKQLKETKVDLIFADIKMPGMNGLEMVEKIRKYNLSDARIVILTGFADFEFARKALRFKISDYLLKPVQTEELESILKSAEDYYSERIREVYSKQKTLLMDILTDKQCEKAVGTELVTDMLTKQRDINSLLDEVRKNDEARQREKKEIGYEVDEFVKEHYKENISLKQISEIFHVNNVYLGQLFKKRHDMLFKDYITSLRIEDADRLLLTTNKRIYQISEELGFASVDIFISKFMQLRGITPNQYRIKKRMQNE